MILRFAPEFHKFTSGRPHLIVGKPTLGECLQQAFETFPQLYVHLMDNKAKVAQESYFLLNGQHVYDVEECARQVQDGDVLELVWGIPCGAGEKTLGYVMSSIQIIAGTVMTIWFNPWGIMLIVSGIVSMTATYLQEDFVPDPGGGLSNSAAYTFNGIKNTTAPGTPLQIVLGKFRVGGQYINVYTEAVNNIQQIVDPLDTAEPVKNLQLSYTTLYAQIGLCEGPIQGASDFQINKLPTNFYNAIDFVDDNGAAKPDNIRLGTANQEPLPQFSRISNTISIGRKIFRPTNLPTSPVTTLRYTDIPVYGYYNADTGTQVYGYFLKGPNDPEAAGNYTPTYEGDPNATILKWDRRNPYLDGPFWAPTQYRLADYTMKRTYATEVPLPMEYPTDGATVIRTQSEANGFTLVLTLPGLYAMSQTVGYMYAVVSVAILYRKMGETRWTIYKMSEVIAGKQRAEILKYYTINGLELARYEIAVIRNTDDHTGWASYCDDIYIKELTEYQDLTLAYPYTAMIGAVIRATDQLSGGLPSVTSLVEGLKLVMPVDDAGTPMRDYVADSSVWGGAMSTDEVDDDDHLHWSDNPIWATYTLLTNERFGLSKYYPVDPDKLPLVRAQFFLQANYCNEMIPWLDEEGVQKTDAFGTPLFRKRFTLNMVLDQSKSASEWLQAIAACCRATLFYTEGVLWVEIDRPKPVTQIFSMTNVKEFQESGTSYRQIPNVYEIQYPNPDQDYELDPFRLESPEFAADPSLEERKKTLTFAGVTEFDQARSLGKFALLAGKKRSRIVSFKTGTDGVRCKATDVIGIQHDIEENGSAGKLKNVQTNDSTYGAASALVTLSSPWPFSAKTMAIQQHGEAPVTVDATVPDTMNAYQMVLTWSDPNFTPAIGASYVLLPDENEIDKFMVVSIRRDADEICELTCVTYDESVYAATEEAAPPKPTSGSFGLPKAVLPNPVVLPPGFGVTDTPASGSLSLPAVSLQPTVAAPSLTGVVVATAAGSHRYWRLNVTSSNNAYAIVIGEIEFRAIVGGVDQCSGGVATASVETNPAARAFDNNVDTFWCTLSGGGTGWIRYDFFPASVEVAEYVVRSAHDGYSGNAPKSWQLQWSDNGTSWTTVDTRSNQTGWNCDLAGTGEPRTFAVPQ